MGLARPEMFSAHAEEEQKEGTSSSSTTQSSHYTSTQDMEMPRMEREDQMYQLKTMCLAKKMVQMPSKEEHGFLLFCGLGARRWQIGMDCNSLSFKQAILNIYPRLRSVIGYNLWALTKDKKNFERIPEKVNTPRRMRSYLGSLFTGCLIVVPVSDIMLMEERREHLRIRDMKEFRDLKAPNVQNMEAENRPSRSSCLICGKMEKMAGTGSFHKILTDTLTCPEGEVLIVKKLGELLGFSFDVTKKRMNVSDEICRRCMKSVKETLQKEEELRSAKAELLATFITTTSKISRNQVAVVNNNCEEAVDDHSSSSHHNKEELQQQQRANGTGGGGGGRSSTDISPPPPQSLYHHHHRRTTHPAPPDLNLHHMGLYGLPESYQQQLLLQTLPRNDMLSSSPAHKSSGGGSSSRGPPAGGSLSSYCRYQLADGGGGGIQISSYNSRGTGGGSDSSHLGRPLSFDSYAVHGDRTEAAVAAAERLERRNYFHGSSSEYARSEVGSSSFISVSPPRQDSLPPYQLETENESHLSCSLSPRPFDAMSFASTFSLKSCNSVVAPKGGGSHTATGGGSGRVLEAAGVDRGSESHKRCRSPSPDTEPLNGGDTSSAESTRIENSFSTGAEAGSVKQETNEDEERGGLAAAAAAVAAATSTLRAAPAVSPSSGTGSSSPSSCSQADEKADRDLEEEEEEAAKDRRKPWKKRWRVQESRAANSPAKNSAVGNNRSGGGPGRADESNESNYEDQLDASHSTPPQAYTPTLLE